MKFRWLDQGTIMAAAAGAESSGGKEDNKENNESAADPNKVKIGSKEYDSNHAQSALTLYEALQDETTGKEIIETLARRAGLLGKDDKPVEGITRKESEAKLESLSTKVLKQKLGKDYEKFADAVGPAFDDIIKEYLDTRFGEVRQQQQATTWGDSVDTFIGQHELTPEIETQMQELIELQPPNFNSKKFNAQKYLTKIYKDSLEELDIEAPEPKARKGRGRSQTDDILPDFVIRDKPKGATIDDAVEAALKGIRFRDR